MFKTISGTWHMLLLNGHIVCSLKFDCRQSISQFHLSPLKSYLCCLVMGDTPFSDAVISARVAARPHPVRR